MISETTLLLLKAVLGVCIFVYLRRRWRMRKVYELANKLTNSYRAWPFIGHAYLAFGTNEDRMNVLKKFSYEAMKNKHGVTGAWIGMKFYVVVAEPNAAEVLTKMVLVKSEMHGLRHITGDGSIFAPIDIWRSRRKIVSPSFSEKRLRLFFDVFAQQTRITLNELEYMVDKGTFSIWDPLVKHSMSSVSRSIFGVNLDSKEYQIFLKALAEYGEQVASRISQPWLRYNIVLKAVQLYEKLENNKRIIHSFVEKAIETTLNEPTEKESSPNNIMEMLIESSGRLNKELSKEELRDELIVLLVAAIDTSASAVGFACLFLAMYPEYQEKAYKEIIEVCGYDTMPSYTQLTKLTYLDAVIKETLRLCPSVPMTARINERNVVKLPTGLTIVPGCEIIISIWGVHRNPQCWGPDAEMFNPDRFINSTIKPSSSFIAFGYGPRNCVGYRFAMMSAKMILSTMLSRFAIVPPSATPGAFDPMKVKFCVMLKHVDKFQVQLQRRTKQPRLRS